jgi:hypothetical protein
MRPITASEGKIIQRRDDLAHVPVVSADVTQSRRPQPGRWTLFAVGGIVLLLGVAGIVTGWAIGTTETTSKTGGEATEVHTTSAPSENVLLGLLGAGGALVVAGAFYSRITAIKLPGGVEVDLSEQEKAAVANKVAEQMGDAEDPAKVAQATVSALAAARTYKADMQAQPLPGDIIEKAAQQGAASASS